MNEETCPVCAGDTFYTHTSPMRDFKKCSNCGHEIITRDNQLDALKREKEDRMQDLKDRGTPKTKEGDIRFPEKHQWQIKDEKRVQEMKDLVIHEYAPKIAPPVKLDRMGKAKPKAETYVNEKE